MNSREIAQELANLRKEMQVPSPHASGKKGKSHQPSSQTSHKNDGEGATAKRTASEIGQWNFEADYNDHFETPLVAYQELQPALQALLKELQIASGGHCTIYDPYYCQGQMVEYMRSIGYENVINRNRDFYHDVHRKTVPDHDILITNPPYSGEHKPKLLNFLAKNTNPATGILRPFALLLPVYIATKSYWKAFVEESSRTSGLQVLYLLPARYYEYAHPENTGKGIPPFYSAWFLGNLNAAMVARIQTAYINFQQPSVTMQYGYSSAGVANVRPLRFFNLTVSTDVQTLTSLGLVTEKRPNPKQRLKKQQQHAKGVNREPNETSNIHNTNAMSVTNSSSSNNKRTFEELASTEIASASCAIVTNAEKSKPIEGFEKSSKRHSKKKKKKSHSQDANSSAVNPGEEEPVKKKKRRY